MNKAGIVDVIGRTPIEVNVHGEDRSRSWTSIADLVILNGRMDHTGNLVACMASEEHEEGFIPIPETSSPRRGLRR